MLREDIVIENGENEIAGRIYNLKKDRKEIRKILLVCHGFYSNRHSSSTMKVSHQLEETDTPVVCFDWPGHGDNKERLTIKNCVNALRKVGDWICSEFPEAVFYLYGSSFGGYMVLLYLSNHWEKHPDRIGEYIFLKSPAVRMDQILAKHLLRSNMEEFRRNGYIIKEGANGMKIPFEFYEELQDNILSPEKIQALDKHIIAFHGDVDRVAPIADLQKLNCSNIEIVELEGAPHSFRGKYIDMMGQKMRPLLS